jgi:hypothetical protein
MISPRDHVSLPVFLPNLCRLWRRAFFGRSPSGHDRGEARGGTLADWTGGGLQTGREQPLQSPKDPAVDSEIPEIRRWMSVLEFHAFWGYVDRIRNEPQECLVNHVESRVITCRH